MVSWEDEPGSTLERAAHCLESSSVAAQYRATRPSKPVEEIGTGTGFEGRGTDEDLEGVIAEEEGGENEAQESEIA